VYRVVTVASFFYVTSNLEVDDLMFERTKSHGFGNLHPYGNSKMANMLFTKELAKRVTGTGVRTYAVCKLQKTKNLEVHLP